MTFAEQLKAQRQRLRLTQAEAAALCEVSPRGWWKWEDGGDTLSVTQEGVIARLKRAKPRHAPAPSAEGKVFGDRVRAALRKSK